MKSFWVAAFAKQSMGVGRMVISIDAELDIVSPDAWKALEAELRRVNGSDCLLIGLTRLSENSDLK